MVHDTPCKLIPYITINCTSPGFMTGFVLRVECLQRLTISITSVFVLLAWLRNLPGHKFDFLVTCATPLANLFLILNLISYEKKLFPFSRFIKNLLVFRENTQRVLINIELSDSVENGCFNVSFQLICSAILSRQRAAGHPTRCPWSIFPARSATTTSGSSGAPRTTRTSTSTGPRSMEVSLNSVNKPSFCTTSFSSLNQ